MELPATIVCVDCGGVAHLLSYERPDEPFAPGDVVAYRCEDCGDRWDLEVSADDDPAETAREYDAFTDLGAPPTPFS
ncbi:MAG: hypothetical protein JJU45_02260 [Acidimicrobiia bacterium]|nr:hypothetical protein [Acidimicrobiia bacterium]